MVLFTAKNVTDYNVRGIAELLNQMPRQKYEAIGDGWGYMLPRIPRYTWRSMTSRSASYIPYQKAMRHISMAQWNAMPVEVSIA